jgi:predicted metal-binding membrane protein
VAPSRRVYQELIQTMSRNPVGTSSCSSAFSRTLRNATMHRTSRSSSLPVPRHMASERVSQRAFFGVSALLFCISAVVTVVWCGSMSAMGDMPMPGGWTMSMAWMRMSGQTWLGAGVSFLGMWVVMMVAMMLPCLIPTLWRYRQAIAGERAKRLGWLTTLVGGGYFFVWTVLGIIIFPVGAGLAELEMQLPALSRAVPLAAAVVVLIAGAFQFTPWKTNHLACCRDTPGSRCKLQADGAAAWRQGLRLGLSCSYCCAGLMSILLVLGVMDLRTMVFVTVAITAERLAPAGEIVARVIGAVTIGMGVFLVGRAAGLC